MAAGFAGGGAPEACSCCVPFLPSSSRGESGASKSACACEKALSEESVGDFAAAPPPLCLLVLVAGSGSCGSCVQVGPELFVTPAAPGAFYASVSVLLYQYSK